MRGRVVAKNSPSRLPSLERQVALELLLGLLESFPLDTSIDSLRRMRTAGELTGRGL